MKKKEKVIDLITKIVKHNLTWAKIGGKEWLKRYPDGVISLEDYQTLQDLLKL